MVNWSAGSSSTNSSLLHQCRSAAAGSPAASGRRRQHQREAGAGARLAGHFDLSAVLLHNLLDDGEPDSGARFARFLRLLGAIELLKDLLDFLLVHADSLVLDGDPHVPWSFQPETVTSVRCGEYFTALVSRL